jgi:hypothetical protein
MNFVLWCRIACLLIFLYVQAQFWKMCSIARDSQLPLRVAKQIYAKEDLRHFEGCWQEWSEKHGYLEEYPQKCLLRNNGASSGQITRSNYRVPDATEHCDALLLMAACMATGEIDGVILRLLLVVNFFVCWNTFFTFSMSTLFACLTCKHL